MNNSANSNIYEVTAAEVLAVYGALVEGSPQSLAIVVSGWALGPKARTALTSSCKSLGLGDEPAWLTLKLEDGTGAGSQDLRTIVEGLDPLAVIAADQTAAALLADAYCTEVPLDSSLRLFGRNAVAFSSFEAMLADGDSKQKAWALLKELRRSS